jgi:hypothetical protein
MSDSNALVKLFGNLMKGLDDDDDKKVAQGLAPVPQLATPPQVTPPVSAPTQQAAPTPVQQGVPPLLARPVQQEVPVDFDPAKLVPIELTQEEEDWIAAQQGVPAPVQQGVPALLAKPGLDPSQIIQDPQAQPSLGFDGIPTLESVQPPPAQEDPYGHLDWGDANRAGFPVWMSDPLDSDSARGAPERIKRIDKRLQELEALRDSGELSPYLFERQANELRFHRKSSEGHIEEQETNLKDRELYKVKRLYDAGLTDQAEALAVELGLPSPSGVPPVELNEDGVPVMIGRPESSVTQEDVDADDAIVNSEGNAKGKEELDEKLEGNSDLQKKGEDEDDDSFLSRLWDGVKDVIVTQFKDPVNQKAMFAYAISRALGYDGATIAGKVLEDGWSRQAEAEKIYGKQVVATEKKRIEDKKIDYSKPITVYHPKTQKNHTIFRTKGGDQFVWEVGGSTKGVDISTLLKKGYEFKTGLTRQDHRDSMLKTLTADTARAFDHISSEGIDNETKAAIRKGIDPAELRSAIDNFVGQYPKGTDFINSNIMNAISRSAGNYVQAISDKRAIGSKDLTGYLDYEKLTLDIKDNGLPSTFFAISKHPEQEIGVNGWSKVNHKVNGLMQSINSQLLKANKDAQPMTKGEVYKALYDEYVTMGAASIDPKDKDDNPFATYWEKASVESSDDKHLSLSPAMLWIQNIDKKPDPSYSPPNGGALIKTLVANRLGKS